MINISYIWGYCHTITNHTIYVRRGTTSTVYFIFKSRTNKTGSISRDTRRSRRQLLSSSMCCLYILWWSIMPSSLCDNLTPLSYRECPLLVWHRKLHVICCDGISPWEHCRTVVTHCLKDTYSGGGHVCTTIYTRQVLDSSPHSSPPWLSIWPTIFDTANENATI